jgi:hypothetical protein
MRQLTHFAMIVGVPLLLSSAPLSADTLHVDDDACPNPGTGVPADPYCAIQTAIDAAIKGDEILVAPGTYAEIIDFDGKAVTLRSSAGPAVTTIDATTVAEPPAGKPVVRCDSGETPDTILDGFTITGGTGDTSLGTRGGGIFIKQASPTNRSNPTITNCILSGNSATFGGGIFCNRSNATISNCVFINNNFGRVVSSSGGGLYCEDSNPTVINCLFQENETGFNGHGSGMTNQTSSPMVINCTFRKNGAEGTGGRMYNEGRFSSGGITSDPIIINCLFTGNTAGDDGGGMFNNGSAPTITNCTFSMNTASDEGGGMHNNASEAMVTNCIFWANSDAGGMDESAQIDTRNGSPIVNYSDVQGGWTGPGGVGNLNADPLFVDPDGPDNLPGTADDDLPLAAGSPCIDAADNNAVPIGVTTDLAGEPRFVDSLITPDTGNGTPPIVDMGAHEAPASVRADVDVDGDVDGSDFAFFSACFNKAGNPPRGGCAPHQVEAFDFDHDNDIDGVDFTKFAQCYNSAGNPPRTLACPQN